MRKTSLVVPKTTFHAYRLVITAESFLWARGKFKSGVGWEQSDRLRHIGLADATLSARSNGFH